MKQKTVLVTGATSGIGKATAILLAAHGYRLVVCGRREAILNELVSTLAEKTEIHPLVFDVRDKEKVFRSIEGLPKDFSQIDVLINNAGNAHGLDPIDSGSVDDWEAMLDINVKGLLYVSKAILPQMVERKAGHIVNIGSTAGKEVYPKGNVYCASKHAVDAINKGMRLDLNAYGIRVGAINPGLVETEFSKVRFKGDEERADTVYKGYQPLRPEDIADLVLFMISRPAHVNLVDLTVMPTAQASSTVIHKTGE